MKTHPLRLKLREATWNAILEAAEQVAAEEGSSNANLQAIAERAGIAVGTIYNYFHDKHELFDALSARRREELYEAIDEAAKEHTRDAFAAQLNAFVGAVFAYFDGRRAFLRMALESESPRPIIVKGKDGQKHRAMQQLQERAERVVRLGVREKRLREESTDLLATILVSIVRGVLVARAQSDQPFSPETARVVSLFLDGAAK
jgi:AcrR family transcriptional regulator